VISPGHRRTLNRALHELRRPLQALTLMEDGSAAPAGAPPRAARRGLLELAGSALAELDRAVNGGPRPPVRREVSCRELVLAALERWGPAAERAGRIRLFWDAGPAPIEADPIAMARALDNLIANALEHGGPPLVLTGAAVAGRVRITIANGCAQGGAPGYSRPNGRPGGNGNGARGNGLEIVSGIAEAHAGRFAICQSGTGCVAALELPLTRVGVARAA